MTRPAKAAHNTLFVFAFVLTVATAVLPSMSRSAAQSSAPPQKTPSAPGTPGHKEIPLNGVRFDHHAHAVTRNIPCVDCHHVSKPEKPSKVAQENCIDCHTAKPAPPMKTSLRAAFHDAKGTAGLCIDCHRTENTKGLKTPVHCLDCHTKAEAQLFRPDAAHGL